MNSTRSNYRKSINFRRRDGESSNKRDGDYVRKRDGEDRIFQCTECEGVGHYQAECLTFLRKQKKNFRATLSDKDTDDSEEK